MCSVEEYSSDQWRGTCDKCDSVNLRRIYCGVPIQWSGFGLDGTRYSDERVERGLKNEERKFGRPLTDEEADRSLRQRGLDFRIDPRTGERIAE